MNRKVRFFGSVLLITVLLSAFFLPGLYGEDKVHTVQKGETFYSIARALGVKVDDLMKYNGINDPRQLQAGQRLKIPVPSVQQPVPVAVGAGEQTNYRVVRGDTLYGIARNFSVTVASIQAANSLPPDYMLREGDSLLIPVKAAPATASAAVAAAAPVQPAVVPRETAAKPADVSLRWPVTARELSYMTGKLSGVVITGSRAEPVNSLTRGTVLSAGPYRGFGRVAIIQVEGGYIYVYGGCESLSVKEGDKVGPGTEIGKLGIDAVSNKPQLFFMVYRSNNPVDPATAPRA